MKNILFSLVAAIMSLILLTACEPPEIDSSGIITEQLEMDTSTWKRISLATASDLQTINETKLGLIITINNDLSYYTCQKNFTSLQESFFPEKITSKPVNFQGNIYVGTNKGIFETIDGKNWKKFVDLKTRIMSVSKQNFMAIKNSGEEEIDTLMFFDGYKFRVNETLVAAVHETNREKSTEYARCYRLQVIDNIISLTYWHNSKKWSTTVIYTSLDNGKTWSKNIPGNSFIGIFFDGSLGKISQSLNHYAKTVFEVSNEEYHTVNFGNVTCFNSNVRGKFFFAANIDIIENYEVARSYNAIYVGKEKEFITEGKINDIALISGSVIAVGDKGLVYKRK